MKCLRLFPAGVVVVFCCLAFPFQNYSRDLDFPTVEVVATPTDGGIREDIPKKYRDRYEKWKAELLSTEFGRGQWEAYAENKGFVLTIKVSGDKEKGAGTDKFQWNDKGNCVGATITLGHEIDEGYPNPIYYPVLNSLSSDQSSYLISGRILAASKLSHELGHVNQTANANMAIIEKQSKLIPEYTSIFLNNGHNTRDSKLVELAQEIGGTPIEIWESREYWSEVTAMNFLKERIKDESYYCFVFKKIKNNLQTYAREYVDRFGPSSTSQCSK